MCHAGTGAQTSDCNQVRRRTWCLNALCSVICGLQAAVQSHLAAVFAHITAIQPNLVSNTKAGSVMHALRPRTVFVGLLVCASRDACTSELPHAPLLKHLPSLRSSAGRSTLPRILPAGRLQQAAECRRRHQATAPRGRSTARPTPRCRPLVAPANRQHSSISWGQALLRTETRALCHGPSAQVRALLFPPLPCCPSDGAMALCFSPLILPGLC